MAQPPRNRGARGKLPGRMQQQLNRPTNRTNKPAGPEPKKSYIDNPSTGFPKSHPYNSDRNNRKLVEHIKARLRYSFDMRETLWERFTVIDREYTGFLKHDADDRKRVRDNQRGLGVKPTDVKLQLVLTQLDEEITYLMSVFAPENGIFEAIATPDKQHIANAFAAQLNKDGERAQYYRNYAKAFLNMLKYNLGGWIVEWQNEFGTMLGNDPSGNLQVQTGTVVWSGNIIESVDVYNLIMDPSVHPVDLNKRGEYFALVDVFRKFDVERMAQNGEIFNVGRFIEQGEYKPYWYRPKPDVRVDIDMAGSPATSTDWVKVMSAGTLGDVSKGYEFVNYYGWIKPKDFGLSSEEKYEIWRIVVAQPGMADDNMGWVVKADRLNNAHGLLPIALGSPNEDDLGMQQKSYAEILTPLQTFGSFLLNAHQRGTRKSLYGVTFYNPNVIPLGDRNNDDMEAAKIPIKPTAFGADFDIRKHLFQVNDSIETSNTMPHLEAVMQLMQKMLPTNINQQVAGLDRATEYQAAAVVQGGNRRNLKIARMINDQSMVLVRHMVMYNFFEFKTGTLEAIDPQTGQPMEVPVSAFRDAGIAFALAEGLKGIDRMMIIQIYKDLMGMIVQSQQALQQLDFMKFFNYIGTLMGDKTDLNQFKIQNPLMMLPPEQQQLLIHLMQTGQLQGLLQEYATQQKQAMQANKQQAQLPAPQNAGR